MHIHTLDRWQHSHNFRDDSHHAELSTIRVLILTVVTMAVEILAGLLFGSMALLADGWHMATHAAAFGITLFAYRYARTHADNPQFTFGTGKVSVLGGFASAVALAVVALFMALESILRLLEPREIQFQNAIGVAFAGLLVNLLCSRMLHGTHEQDHYEAYPNHNRDRHSGNPHQDHNLRAAYLHVLADALTSVLAILALVAGKYLGWNWMDPVMGLVGAAVITRWSFGLMHDTSYILLDSAAEEGIRSAIRRAIEEHADNRIADLHVWYVGPRHYSAGLSVVTHHPNTPDHYKDLLRHIPCLAHVLVEVNVCDGKPCLEKVP